MTWFQRLELVQAQSGQPRSQTRKIVPGAIVPRQMRPAAFAILQNQLKAGRNTTLAVCVPILHGVLRQLRDLDAWRYRFRRRKEQHKKERTEDADRRVFQSMQKEQHKFEKKVKLDQLDPAFKEKNVHWSMYRSAQRAANFRKR